MKKGNFMNWWDEKLYKSILIGDCKKRYTKRDKQNFIDLLKESIKSLEVVSFVFPCVFLPFIRGRNLIIGDINSADVVLTAHYDTPSVPPYNYLYSQIHFVSQIKNPTLFKSFIIAFAAAIIGFELAVFIFALFANYQPVDPYYWLIVIVTVLFACTCWLKYMLFAPNKNNANDNSSGVCLALHLYRKNSKIAVILFDQEEKGRYGSKALRSVFQNNPYYKNKLFINLDTIGCRDILLLSQDNEATYFEEKSSYQGKPTLNGFENNKHTDYTSLPNGRRVGVSTNNGNADKKGTRNYGPIHSIGDTTVDFEMMTIVESFVEDVIEKYEKEKLR